MKDSLDAIGLRKQTDKASNHHDYLSFYESRLEYLREDEVTLFEIGVFKGASVSMWEEYFPEGNIIGVDYDEECKKYQTDRVKIVSGNAGDPVFLKQLISDQGIPQIIIDDGSHRWDHQILGLQTLFPLLPSGGHYIIEDIDTSFEAHLRDAPFQGESLISAFDYVYKLARVVVGEAALGTESPYDLFIANNASMVSTIEFYRRTVMINKK